MSGAEDSLHGRFNFLSRPDEIPVHEQAQQLLIEKQRAERELLQSLTPELLQFHFERMFTGMIEERTHSIRWWTDAVRLLPAKHSISYQDITLRKVFEVLSSLILKDAEPSIQRAGLTGLASVFRHRNTSEVTKFLAHQVCDETWDDSVRIQAYWALWMVTSERPREKKSRSADKPQLKPDFTKHVSDFLVRWRSYMADSQHFLTTRQTEFSLKNDVRWEWVRSFLQ